LGGENEETNFDKSTFWTHILTLIKTIYLDSKSVKSISLSINTDFGREAKNYEALSFWHQDQVNMLFEAIATLTSLNPTEVMFKLKYKIDKPDTERKDRLMKALTQFKKHIQALDIFDPFQYQTGLQ